MDENRASGAAASRFFILICPSTVVGERLALEEFFVSGRRFIDHHQQHFAANIDPLVVIPVIFRGFDSIAHKDDGRIDISGLSLRLVVGYVIVKQAQIEWAALIGNETEASL